MCRSREDRYDPERAVEAVKLSEFAGQLATMRQRCECNLRECALRSAWGQFGGMKKENVESAGRRYNDVVAKESACE
jgi:hypothetical protein